MESPIRKSKDLKKERLTPEINNANYINAQLKGKLKILTAEMKDAVERMNSMTIEMNTIRNENLLYKDRLAELEQENALLVSQIEEMANDRAERDAIIEEFGTAVEARIIEWKEILDEKDSTIAKLKENLMYAATDRLANTSPDERTHTEIERLIQDIDRRDEIIAELQSKLAEAVVEINESTVLIEKFKSDGKTKDSSKRGTKEQREMNKKIQDADKRISTLENLLERAEKDAKIKSEQLCEALAILNKYEDENTSLTEALEEIKELKSQVEKKNRHIEDLVDVINRLENENSRFEDAIIILREKLGITEEDESSIEELILQRQQAHDDKIEEMQRQYDQLYSENVDLKFQIRKLKTALKESLKNKLTKSNGISSDGETVEELSLRSESKKEHIELRRIKENVKWVIEENEALRQGMHEILDCVHNQDGKSIVTIQSQTLENLLEALDARHLAGWYHPAMRLQGRVNYLQGNNAELRAQLQQIRSNQLMLQEQLQRSSSVEEGECSQRRDSQEAITPDVKTDIQVSPSPKSARSGHSQTADSGRASGKAGESDEIQQADEDEEPRSGSCDDTSPMDDEGIGKKSEEVYAMAKEIIAQESDFKKALNDAEKQRRLLDSQIIGLRKSLASYVAPEVHNELREKYLEASLRLRAAFEDKYAMGNAGMEDKEIESLRNRAVQELRDELVSLHKQLSELTMNAVNNNNADVKTVEELENNITELKVENERLKKAAEMAHEEALIHRAIDSTVLTEFNELRQRILRFEMDEGQEIKEIARLSFELANYKVIETELREQKKILERELSRTREELWAIKKRGESDEGTDEESRKSTNCSDYVEIIDFLQYQYAGSTSLSAWERYEANLNKLNNDRNEINELMRKINDQNESLKMQHETLTGRLQIVEQLKDMLEQQIGSSEVQDIMKRFTSQNRQILEESKYKMQINQLVEETKKASLKIIDYETKLSTMEHEMNKVQKAWKVQKMSSIKRTSIVDKGTETHKMTEEVTSLRQSVTKSSQTELKVHSVETQCLLCCKLESSIQSKEMHQIEEVEESTVDQSDVDINAQESEDEDSEKATKISLLQEQLSRALALASERSVALSKCEAQLVEHRAKNDALTKLLEERKTATNYEIDTVPSKQANQEGIVTSHEALQSSIKSLQRIIAQKEETIARYQGMLKEDRDKHSEAAASLQEEIKSLRRQIAEQSVPATDNGLMVSAERPERDSPSEETGGAEKLSLLREKISRLETELSISGQLAERWHRLAEDRLRHMDSSIARLEAQHQEEIKSYRIEINKRQHEVDELRCQLSENRRAPTTKTEVLSFMKALQIKDNRLADEIENELEEHVAVTSQQLSTTYEVEDSRHFEYEHSQSQLDNLRRQLQASMEREKSMKNELKELQRQLSRKYMAVKVQEKKTSRREMQLEKKVKELEEELHEAKEMLDRHFAVQQAKRAKTAEDLGLWEKLKKWQQTAEKLKEKMKDKTEECQRLQNNYEKLRTLISCMEREKWFLRGKCTNRSSENVPVQAAAWTPTTDDVITAQNNDLLVQELQRECQELRDRVKELLAQLSRQTSERNEEKKRSVSAAFGDDEFINEEVKKLLEVNEMLRKENIRLETENFELRLQLERANVNTPRYEETIKHLEKYIELLKSEKSMELVRPPRRDGTQRTKAELERTVVTLQKLVEKLQHENKKLRSSVTRSSDFTEQQCNCIYLRDEYEQALHRIASLETDLELAEKKIMMMEETTIEKSDEDGNSEIAGLRQQLKRKSDLLEKVKDLLAKAAINEKALRQRIHQLEFHQTLSAIPECGTPLGMT